MFYCDLQKVIVMLVISTSHTRHSKPAAYPLQPSVRYFMRQSTNDAPRRNKSGIKKNIYKYIPPVLFVRRISIRLL